MGVVIECIRIIEDSDKRGSDKRGCTVYQMVADDIM